MKSILNVLLGISIVFVGYICVMSVLTPIQFEEEKVARDQVVVRSLINIRAAQVEYREVNGRYTDSFDSLVIFLKDAKKKTVLKEGSLTDAQLEEGLTEAKAVKILQKGNKREIKAKGLENFRRDTVYNDMIQSLYNGLYTHETIAELAVIPFSEGKKFEMEVNNEYVNNSGIAIPLFEARASYDTYLHDLNRQERINTKDVAIKLDRYPGLKVGSVEEPNNNGGNWE